MAFDHVVFIQQVRTPSSEVWVADESRTSPKQLAQIDIHFPPAGGADVTVSLLRPMPEPVLAEFLDRIDGELISTADESRGNLRFRVIQNGTAEMYHPRAESKAPGSALDGADFLGGLNG